MPFVVREKADGDLDAWARMRAALWPEASVEAHRAEIAAIDDLAVFFAVGADGEAVGFLELSVRPYANGAQDTPVPFVEGVWVEAAFRRAGVGRALVEAAEAWARRHGFRELLSDVLIDNEASLSAHAAWGFAEVERVVALRKPLKASASARGSAATPPAGPRAGGGR
jgi:aminoglycoside 6'-N-acetyltransferase I